MDIPAEIAEQVAHVLARYRPHVNVSDDQEFGEAVDADQIGRALEQATEFGRLCSEHLGRIEFRTWFDYLDADGDERTSDLDRATPEQLTAARALALVRLTALNQEAAKVAAQYIGLTRAAESTTR